MQPSRHTTMHESVAEAALNVERMARHDPGFKSSAARDDMYATASSPDTDWPEPRMAGLPTVGCDASFWEAGSGWRQGTCVPQITLQ
jgi:hypothetical protein